jgi:hypothetical protein
LYESVPAKLTKTRVRSEPASGVTQCAAVRIARSAATTPVHVPNANSLFGISCTMRRPAVAFSASDEPLAKEPPTMPNSSSLTAAEESKHSVTDDFLFKLSCMLHPELKATKSKIVFFDIMEVVVISTSFHVSAIPS